MIFVALPATVCSFRPYVGPSLWASNPQLLQVKSDKFFCHVYIHDYTQFNKHAPNI